MSEPEVVFIETLDQFVKALQQWHYNKVQVLKHMQEIPEGTEVAENDGPPAVLTGDMLKGFKLGIEVSLSEMGELPFHAEVDFTSDESIITDPSASSH